MSINRVNISGNLTRDPELRATQGGTQVLRFAVAVNDRRKDPADGQWKDYPNYIDCVVFGARAEALSRFLAKGAKVAVEGKLRWSQWQDRESGKNRSKVEVVVDEVELMSRRDGGQAQSAQAPAGAPRGPQKPAYAAPAPAVQQLVQEPSQAAVAAASGIQQAPAGDVYDADIPF